MTEPAISAKLQATLDALNAEDPPDYDPPWFLAIYRHPCTKARQSGTAGKGVSTAIDLKEVYVRESEVIGPVVPEDELAIIWRHGWCKRCGQTARSQKGRIVLVRERPPISGRVARA